MLILVSLYFFRVGRVSKISEPHKKARGLIVCYVIIYIRLVSRFYLDKQKRGVVVEREYTILSTYLLVVHIDTLRYSGVHLL